MKKFVVVSALLLFAVGCAQCGSFWDGISGMPMDQHTDIPGWYHFGALITPIISQLLAIFRIIWPLLLPLLA